MQRKKRRCILFVYKIWGIFRGPRLPPTRKSSRLLNFRRSNLNLAVVRSSILLPVRPEKIRKVFCLGGSPPPKVVSIWTNFIGVLGDHESYVKKSFYQNLSCQFFFIRPFMFCPMPQLLKISKLHTRVKNKKPPIYRN